MKGNLSLHERYQHVLLQISNLGGLYWKDLLRISRKMYLWLQVIHENCKVGGVVTETGSDTRTDKGHPAAVTGPAVGVIMTRRSKYTLIN